MKIKLYILSIFLLLTLSSVASAQTTNIIFDADFMEKNNKEKTITLKDNVNVIFQQQHLLADEATIYENNTTVIARGNITLQTPKTTLRGEKLEFNYKTNKGKLFKGVVTSGQVLIESDVIEKIGEEEYVADNAYYTACLTCPPSWGFTSSRVRAEIGGYAYINRPWLHILQVPIVPLPYLVVPLNTKRQTGLLVPKPSNSGTGGLAIEQPFFWAIDRSSDATFSAIHYEKKGWQAKTNYRYVISPKSSGELNTAFMKDRAFNYNDRWFVNYKHVYKLPNNYTQRMDIAMTSDRIYPREFPGQFPYNGFAALDNRISIAHNENDSHLSLDSSYYVSLIEDNLTRLETDKDSLPIMDKTNKDGLHRLPEINYVLMDQKISDDYNIFANFEAQYLNVSRQDLAYDHIRNGTFCDLNNVVDADGNNTSANNVDGASDICVIKPHPNGEYTYGEPGTDPVTNSASYGDLVRTGQRLDMVGRVHAPFWVGKVLDVDPSFSARYTQYSLGVQSDEGIGYDSFPSRFYTQFDLSTKSYLSRVFDWSKETKMKHSIIPEVSLRYIPEIHQTKNHFFGDTENVTYFREKQPIDDSDLDWRNGGRGIQFDQRDSVIERQYVNFGLTNKLISRRNSITEGLFNQYKQNLVFNISQAFDIREARKGENGRPWQDLQTHLAFNSEKFHQSLVAIHFPYHNKTRWVSRSRFYFSGNNSFGIDYTRSFLIEQFPPVDEKTRTEIMALNTGLNFKYLYLYGQLEYDIKLSEYKRWTVRSIIRPPGKCWTIQGFISQRLDTDDINYSLNMEFQFGK